MLYASLNDVGYCFEASVGVIGKACWLGNIELVKKKEWIEVSELKMGI